ncbi:relaxin-3-like [Myotis myotis]|uniref:relaxin-3-like n=1 Tax=Myotis myotis TaxID=51298 RepID=UPI00174E63A7|nr:relaxin-3-like [Myotis myotis]
MAKHPLLLLLAVWVLAGGLWLEAEARGAPYGVKLCGREFIRAVIFTCGGSRWRRSDNLAQEAMEKDTKNQRSKFTFSGL